MDVVKIMTYFFLSLLISLLLTVSGANWPTHTAPVTSFNSQTETRPAPQVIPFELINRHIFIPVRVNDSRPLWFVLDTGDQYAIINLDTAKQLGLKLRGQVSVGGAGAQTQTGAFVDGATFVMQGLKGFSQPVTIRSLGAAGAGGETSGRIGRITSLKIGRFVIKEPITFFSEDKVGAFASPALSGNIGTNVASKVRVFLDYGRKQIIFEPNSTFSEPFNQSTAGISLIAEGNDYRTFKITGVLENSPAQEAGLLEDDVIIAVDDRTSINLTLSLLNDLFEQPVRRKLTIRRANSTVEITLTPRRLI